VGLALLASLSSSPIVRGTRTSLALIDAGDLAAIEGWEPPSFTPPPSSILSPQVEFEYQDEPTTYSNRVSALSPSSRSILSSRSIWSHLDEERVNNVEQMEVWDGISGARIQFHRELLGFGEGGEGEKGVAYMVENLNLQRACLRAIRATQVAPLMLDKTKLLSITPSSSSSTDTSPYPLLQTSSTSHPLIRTRLLVSCHFSMDLDRETD
jgi:ubiquinone biosynthesis monooxygenase Coq6